MNISKIELDNIIDKHFYLGIAEQDGMETLEYTICFNHPKHLSKMIMDRIKERLEAQEEELNG